MENIWKIEEPEDFIIALWQYICEKCQYGEKMSVLSTSERVFFITQILEIEVNNGSFAQFFFNPSGDFANEVVDAFTEIGAVKTAEICRRAVSVYGEKVPGDRDKRDEMLWDNEEIDGILSECDDAYFAYEDNLIDLSYKYVLKNKAMFS